MTQPNSRFLVLAASTMLDLLAKMQVQSHPIAQLKYFGKNEGDYSEYENQDLVAAAKFIAVFDFAPVYIVELENVQITQTTGESDGSGGVTIDMQTTMSA